ncbi:alfin [Nonomuraea sp. MG754425]|nr:alfin [Nonomuraea sp. MG754425]
MTWPLRCARRSTAPSSPSPTATVTRLRQKLDHLAWLDGMAGASDAWLKGVPASKIAHFAAEARALDAPECAIAARLSGSCWRRACCTRRG